MRRRRRGQTSFTAAAPTPPAGTALRSKERQIVAGLHTLRKTVSEAIDTARRSRPPARVRGSSTPGTAGSRSSRRRRGSPARSASCRASRRRRRSSQNGTMTENTGNWRPIMADRSRSGSPVTAASAMTGEPSAPKATGAVLAMSDRPEAASGVKPRPIRIAPVTATGVPKPAAPSKNAPKQKAISSSCRRRSSVIPLMLSCSTLNSPSFSVSL